MKRCLPSRPQSTRPLPQIVQCREHARVQFVLALESVQEQKRNMIMAGHGLTGQSMKLRIDFDAENVC